MKRERVDKSKSRQVIKRVILPFYIDLGAKHLVDNFYMGMYDHENKSISYGLGHKRHGDKRHRSSVKFEGIFTTRTESRSKARQPRSKLITDLDGQEGSTIEK